MPIIRWLSSLARRLALVAYLCLVLPLLCLFSRPSQDASKKLWSPTRGLLLT
jgi:hypothetical protein